MSGNAGTFFPLPIKNQFACFFIGKIRKKFSETLSLAVISGSYWLSFKAKISQGLTESGKLKKNL